MRFKKGDWLVAVKAHTPQAGKTDEFELKVGDRVQCLADMVGEHELLYVQRGQRRAYVLVDCVLPEAARTSAVPRPAPSSPKAASPMDQPAGGSSPHTGPELSKRKRPKSPENAELLTADKVSCLFQECFTNKQLKHIVNAVNQNKTSLKDTKGLTTKPTNKEIADRLSKLELLHTTGGWSLLIWMEDLEVGVSIDKLAAKADELAQKKGGREWGGFGEALRGLRDSAKRVRSASEATQDVPICGDRKSTRELKELLQKRGVAKDKIAACVEREDLEKLLHQLGGLSPAPPDITSGLGAGGGDRQHHASKPGGSATKNKQHAPEKPPIHSPAGAKAKEPATSNLTGAGKRLVREHVAHSPSPVPKRTASSEERTSDLDAESPAGEVPAPFILMAEESSDVTKAACEYDMVMLSMADLDDRWGPILKDIEAAANAKLLMSSQLQFPFFSRAWPTAFADSDSALQSDYVKVGGWYVQQLYNDLGTAAKKSVSHEKLVETLLCAQLDRKFRPFKQSCLLVKTPPKDIMSAFPLSKPVNELQLPTVNLVYETKRSAAKPTCNDSTHTWLIPPGSGGGAQYLPGDDGDRVSVLRLYSTESGQHDAQRLDGYVFIFRKREDVEKLWEHWREMEEANRTAEINERPITLQIDVPARNVTSFLTVTNKEEFKEFLKCWEEKVREALNDPERAKPPDKLNLGISLFAYLECCALDDSEVKESSWRFSAQGMPPSELCVNDRESLISEMDKYDQVATVSFRLHLKGEQLPETKTEAESKWRAPGDGSVFPEQESVARRIRDRISFVVWEEMQKTLEDFTDLGFVILVPTFAALRDQTLIRIQDIIPTADRTRVFFYTMKNEPTIRKFQKEAEQTPSKLFLLIADECHWGVGKDAAHDCFINDARLCDLPNVFMLLVSATPYNVLTCQSRIPCRVIEDDTTSPWKVSADTQYNDSEDLEELHVIEWFPKRDQHKTAVPAPRKYLRMEQYLQTLQSKKRHNAVGLENRPLDARKIRSDPWFEGLKKQFLKKSKFDVVLLADYIFSLVYFVCVRWDHEASSLKDLKNCNYDDDALVLKAKEAIRAFQDLTGSPSNEDERELAKVVPKYLVQLREMLEDDDDLEDEEERPVSSEELALIFRQKLEEEMQRDLPGAPHMKQDVCSLTETDLIIRDLLASDNGKGRMKMLRTCNEKTAVLWDKKLKECHKKLFHKTTPGEEKPFAVIMDTGSMSLYNRLEPWVLKRRVPGKDHSIKDIGSGLQYIDLLDLPCILILVDKGRMGDTFPHSMDCLDLRIRVSLNRTTLIQEFGRLCRYPIAKLDSPEIIVDSWDDAANVAQHFARGKRVAVFHPDTQEFMGYASHMNNFEALADIKLCGEGRWRLQGPDLTALEGATVPVRFYEGHNHRNDMDYVLGVENRNFDRPQVIRLSDSGEQMRAAARDTGSSYKVSLRRHSTSQKMDMDSSKATHTGRLPIVTLGVDVASLEYLFWKCGNRCIVRPVSYPFPYALIRDDVMQKLQNAVECADMTSWKDEIIHCVQLDSLDRYMSQKEKSRFKSFHDYHQYRRRWRASTNTNIHYDVDRPVGGKRHSRRFLLFAECQIGKTGGYVSLLDQLREAINPSHDVAPCVEIEVVEPETKVHTPKAVHWMWPYWLEVAKAKPGQYFRIGDSKYREKFAVFRFRALMDCCTESGPNSWVDRYQSRLIKDECILSKGSLAALELAMKNLQSEAAPSKWTNTAKDEFENFLQDDSKRATVEEAVDWDRRLNWETDHPLIGDTLPPAILDIRPVQGRADTAAIYNNLPSSWSEVYNAPRQDCVETAAADPDSTQDVVVLAEGQQVVKLAVPASMDIGSPSKLRNADGRCERLNMFLDPSLQKGELSLRSITQERIRLSVPKRFIEKRFLRVKGELVSALEEKAGRFRWIFHPTSGREEKALLDYSECFGDEDFAQVFVVKGEDEVDRYMKVWKGYPHAIILGLPNSMRADSLFPGTSEYRAIDCGVGFARLFIQIVGYLLGLQFVWVLDDNIVECRQMDLDQIERGSHSRDRPPKVCSVREPMEHLEGLVDHPPAPPDEVESEDLAFLGHHKDGWRWKAHPGDDGLWSEKVENASDCTVPVTHANLPQFLGCPSGIGLLGMHRCWTTWMTLSSPFKKTHSVYSFVLLNVKDTCERRVFYAPKPAWEDIDFAFDLMDRGFQVVKSNRWFHSKLNFHAKFKKPEKEFGDAHVWNEKTELAIVKAQADHPTSKQCWLRMRSYVEAFIEECGANCLVVGPSNLPSWRAFTAKSGLPGLLFPSLKDAMKSKADASFVVFAQPMMNEDIDSVDLPSLAKNAMEFVVKKQEEAGWQHVLFVLTLDAASATRGETRWKWKDFDDVLKTVAPERNGVCTARVLEIATTAQAENGSIQAFSSCEMNEHRSRRCAESFFLLRVGFGKAGSELAANRRESTQAAASSAPGMENSAAKQSDSGSSTLELKKTSSAAPRAQGGSSTKEKVVELPEVAPDASMSETEATKGAPIRGDRKSTRELKELLQKRGVAKDKIAACVERVHLEQLLHQYENKESMGDSGLRRPELPKETGPIAHRLTAAEELAFNESGGSSRVRIPRGCSVSFREPQNGSLKDIIRVEKVAPSPDMKSAASRNNNAVTKGQEKINMVMGGPVYRFEPSGANFDPPVSLRLPIDTDLQDKMRVEGVDCEVGVFMWSEEECCWKEVGDVKKVNDSEVEVLSPSFSSYATGFHSFVKRVVSLFSHNPPQVYCLGLPEKEIAKDRAFDFKVKFFRAKHIAAEAEGADGVVAISEEENLLRCEIPTKLRVSLDGHNFEEQRPAGGYSFDWTELTDDGCGSVNFVLKYTPQNEGDPVRLWASIHGYTDGRTGPRLKHLYFSFCPNQRVAPSRQVENSALPRFVAFFSRSRADVDLDTERESQNLRRILSGVYDFHPHARPSFEDLQMDLWNAKKWKTEVLHFAGHGDSEGLHWVTNDDGIGYVVKENSAIAKPVGRVSTSHGGRLACVVLNACSTKTLGELMVSEGVPRVICWNGALHEEDARTFADSFYKRLCHLCTEEGTESLLQHIDAAFEVGKEDVDTARGERKRKGGSSSGVDAHRGRKSCEMVPKEALACLIKASGVAAASERPSPSKEKEEPRSEPVHPLGLGDMSPEEAAPCITATANAIETCIEQLSTLHGPAVLGPDQAKPAALELYQLTEADMIMVLDKALDVKGLRALLGLVRSRAVDVQPFSILSDQVKGKLLSAIMGLRLRAGGGVNELVEWMLLKGMVKKGDLKKAAQALKLNRNVAKTLHMLARPSSAAPTPSPVTGRKHAAPPQHELTEADMVLVLDKAVGAAGGRTLLSHVKDNQEDVQGDINLNTALKKQELLPGLMKLRVESGGGVHELVEWMIQKKMLVKRDLVDAAKMLGLRAAAGALSKMSAAVKRAKVDGCSASTAMDEEEP